MAGYKVAFLLFGLAVASALPQAEERINWPDRPGWWPDRFPWPPWPPQFPEDAPVWWPEERPWPPQKPTDWPDRPVWWPSLLPWPPALPTLPDSWPDRPNWWPESLQWPPTIPTQWPDRPSFWPEGLPWPPTIPDEWPDRPSFWPDSLPWPPALPQDWPDRPDWWPDVLPWPPGLPDLDFPPISVNPDQLPYIPLRDNQFHLFTRNNPSMSQPLAFHNKAVLRDSHFDGKKKTIVLVHDIDGDATSLFNIVLVPAFLAAGDVNVLVIDWSAGAQARLKALSVFYSVLSGNFNSRFLNWMADAGNADLSNFHLVGVGLGGWNVGFMGFRVSKKIGHITALDLAYVPEVTRFLPAITTRAAAYVEVIHTDAGQRGQTQSMGHVSFYPNGGRDMPGCADNSECNRNRAVYYFAESIQSGGFSGVECENWREALNGNCHGPGTLNMGGMEPKIGSRGVYYLRTNELPPFSQS